MSKLRSQLDNLTADMQPGISTGPNTQQRRETKIQAAVNRAQSTNSGTQGRAATGNGRQDIPAQNSPIQAQNTENRQELAQIKYDLLTLTRQFDNASHHVGNPGVQNNEIASDAHTGQQTAEMRADPRQDLRQEMGSEIDKMRSDLGALQQNANAANDRLVLDDIQRISEGIRELQTRKMVSPKEFGEMAGEMRTIHRDIRTLSERPQPQFDAQEISNSIKSSYEEIAKRLDSLGSSQSSGQIDVLSEKLETIKESIPAIDATTLQGIENQLKELSAGISTLADGAGGAVSGKMESFDTVLPGYFEGMDRRLDEITRAVMASASSENDKGDEQAIGRIEARIASLAKSVEGLSQENNARPAELDNPQIADLMQMPEQLQATLTRLESRISELAAPAAPGETKEYINLADQISTVTQKIESLQAKFTDTANMQSSEINPGEIADIDNKLDVLSQTLERAINSGDGSVGQLEKQVAGLADRIEQTVAAGNEEQQNRSTNDARIVEEIQTLVARVEQIDLAQSNTRADDAPERELQLSALEQQISSIASQLQSVGNKPDFSGIESRLGSIEEKFSANQDLTRDMAIEAANQAAQQVVSQQVDTEGGANGQNSAISALAEDLKSLTRSSTELKGRSLETFDAVRESLAMILDRINGIELRMNEEELPAASANAGATSGTAASAPPQVEIHNAGMVNAAREYADNLASSAIDTLDTEAPDENMSVSNSTDELPGELPAVDAPSLDLQQIPATNEVMAGDDMPLEPGSGVPDLSGTTADDKLDMDGLMRRAKENKQKKPKDDEDNPTDFIAAARRAAQAAANEADRDDRSRVKPDKSDKKPSLIQLISRRKKTLMAGVALVALAYFAYPVATKFLATGSPEIVASQPLEQPAVENTSEAELSGADTISESPSRIVELQPDNSNPTVEAGARDINATGLAAALSEAPSEQMTEGAEMRAATDAPMPPDEVGPIALRQAAASGDAKAQFEVGRRYTAGINNVPDLEEAAKWYQRSAELEYAPAQYRLGNFYEKGNGIASDADKAALWYQRAATQGNALAMHNLAVINAMGVLEGGANMDEAAIWFNKAADHGVKDSQVNLGILYAKAMGVEADLAQAYKWFSIAAKAGDKDAAQKRDTVAKLMRPDQLSTARGEVELWQPIDLIAEANAVEIPDAWKSMPTVSASLTNAETVRKTQTMLTKLGFEPGIADGVMGGKTASAIKKFQAHAGIAVNGEITDDLIKALEKEKI